MDTQKQMVRISPDNYIPESDLADRNQSLLNTIRYWRDAHETNNRHHQIVPGACIVCLREKGILEKWMQ